MKSIEECMAFAGVHHITIAPPLLEQLATTRTADVEHQYPSLFDKDDVGQKIMEQKHYFEDESAFRMAVTRNDNGTSEAKLIQVSRIHI